MFDFHMHSSLSFDSECPAEKMILAAERLGLKEICFTDHFDYNDDRERHHDIYTPEDHARAYDHLHSESVLLRKGTEFGLTPWNQKEIADFLAARELDYALGSIHYVDGYDPYYPQFWGDDPVERSFERYLLKSLECVKSHKDFDVLGHINYVCKSNHSPTKKLLNYADFADICDEIMKTLAENGKGMEINTSGVDRVGDFLASRDYMKRFRELGGEIVTVGSDAHDDSRVGQYIDGALEIARDVFGYVCTFEKRKPIFHKL